MAGSDSGGGAGIQADLKAFQACGVFGTSALTAVTAQNPRGVRAIQSIDPAVLRDQIEAVLEVFTIRAAKCGMLFSSAHIREVAAAFRERPDLPLVVDPVMVATSGARLLEPEAVEALVTELLPLATILTPNLAEAGILLGGPAPVAATSGVARQLAEACGCAVLLKGGHAAGNQAQDVLWEGGRGWVLRSDMASTAAGAAHGTGCSLSAALAAGLACGQSMLDAVQGAKAYVFGALQNAVWVGESVRTLWPVPAVARPQVLVEAVAESAPSQGLGGRV